MSWVDYLMVDSHNAFPRYPLEHEVIKPIVNFPEISMWGLMPWSGFGANPLPQRFQRFWDESKRILSGGMPYSEGIYEDISKIQCVGYYWEPDRHYRDILAEYIGYEYSREVCDSTLKLLECIEENHTAVATGELPDLETSHRAVMLAKEIDACLSERAKKAWRWRILYIRAILDEKRYEAYLKDHRMEPLKELQEMSGNYLIEDEEAQDLFRELQGYFFSVEANGENEYTLPPLGGCNRLNPFVVEEV